MWARGANYPFAAHFDDRLQAWDCIVLAAISAAPHDEYGWTRIGTRSLADVLGVSRPWLQGALKRLEEAGWLEVRGDRRDPFSNAALADERRVNWNNQPGNAIARPVNEAARFEGDGSPLPDDFPTAEAVDAALAEFPKLQPHMQDVIDRFRRHHETEQSLRRSWPKAFREWCKRAWRDYGTGSGAERTRAGDTVQERQRANATRIAEAAAGDAIRRADQERPH